MPVYIVLLRAVNVGGTGKLPMTDLKRMCEEVGFTRVQTYIASGNVVLESTENATKVKAALETVLLTYAGKAVGVIVRTVEEMVAVLASNPFPDAVPKYSIAIFLDQPPPPNALNQVRDQIDERVSLGKREIYVDFGERMGRSKIKIPAAAEGTARNFNTITKLVSLAQARQA